MVRWNKICGLMAIFLVQALLSTGQTVKNSSIAISSKAQSDSILAVVVKNEKSKPFPAPSWFTIVAANYYIQHFGFICKKELVLQKAIKVPLYIRLGSLQQCNYLEGKR